MAQETEIQTQIAQTIILLRKKLGAKGKTLAESVRRAKRRLPRKVYKQAMELARAEPLVEHPKLRLTLDSPTLEKAAKDVQSHLRAINLADRRWGWFLGMLGGLAFNTLALAALFLVVLWWRGLI